uniref:procollagen-proline 4-dioxygenase n=1 Tax=Graphocephala atropunctata TaxID=36148 RepID=A0A1B6L429_9HEMI
MLVDEVESFTEDTQGAIRGLTRLQKVYNLDTDRLTDGWVGGTQAHSILTAADCVEVAQFLSQRHEFVLATSWLRTALSRVDSEGDTTMSQQDVASQLYVYSMLAMCEQDGFAPLLSQSLLSHDIFYSPNAATAKLYLLALDESCSWYDPALKLDEVDMTEDEHHSFNKMCRGEPKGPRGLKCHYVHYHQPSLLLAPFKLEEVVISPPIVLVHQVISDTEIQELKEASLSKLSGCETVYNVITSKASTYRTCDKGWVEDSDAPVAARLTRRVGQLANLGMTFSEQHQVACYSPGGEFKLHRDTLENMDLSETNLAGQRIATVMFYLSDVAKGGYSVFPLLKVAVAPVKGSIIYWFNILHDSSEDHRTLHGGCPVLLGTKWVLNKFIREGGQKLQGHPCRRDEHFPKEYFYV